MAISLAGSMAAGVRTDFWSDLTSNPALTKALPVEFVATLQMVGISALLTLLIGLPLGVLLYLVAPGGLKPMPVVSAILSGVIVNITRSIPFAILMVALIPVARFITGSSIGPIAASVSLTIGTIPFFARLVEVSLREIDAGKIDAARIMGSTTTQIVRKVLLPEAKPSLIAAFTTTVVTIIGYSAMAGVVGGGGLGRLAYNYGVQRFDVTTMVVIIIIIVILVQAVQLTGDWLARKADHRNRDAAAKRPRRARNLTAS
ncbi:methionine ABC transporter permease [Haematomicrobium sanguinis]|uniref:methionine ABC transporter permease n=1 Tax=Haematomicrobium sanguinis TaxID=479106 RepID=UPI000AA1B60A|nr:methionine ABC transporter permease [Haematomicrobium sanguinis]